MDIPQSVAPALRSSDQRVLVALKNWLGLYGSCYLFTRHCDRDQKELESITAADLNVAERTRASTSRVKEEPPDYCGSTSADTPRPEDLLLALLATAQCLNEENVPYVLGGGLAINLHGQQRATRDVDFFVMHDPDLVSTLLPSLANREVRPHIHEGPSFMPPDAIFWFQPLQYGLPDAPPVDVDLLVANDEFMAFLHATGIEAHVNDVRIRVLGAEGLLLLKLRAFRDIDRWDAKSILRSEPDLDRSLLESWAEKLGLTERLEQMEREITEEGDRRYG